MENSIINEHNDFLDIVKITYFTPENAVFSRTKNGFPSLRAFIPQIKKDDLEETTSDEPIWQDIGRVFFHRAFPFDSANSFISVTDKDGNEYGMIKNLSDFDGNGQDIIQEELDRKYFTPVIIKINSLKDRFGYSYWDVETEQGNASFTMRDTFSNIARASETRLVLTDVDGNRYEIPDVTVLDKKSFRKIELYL